MTATKLHRSKSFAQTITWELSLVFKMLFSLFRTQTSYLLKQSSMQADLFTATEP